MNANITQTETERKWNRVIVGKGARERRESVRKIKRVGVCVWGGGWGVSMRYMTPPT